MRSYDNPPPSTEMKITALTEVSASPSTEGAENEPHYDLEGIGIPEHSTLRPPFFELESLKVADVNEGYLIKTIRRALDFYQMQAGIAESVSVDSATVCHLIEAINFIVDKLTDPSTGYTPLTSGFYTENEELLDLYQKLLRQEAKIIDHYLLNVIPDENMDERQGFVNLQTLVLNLLRHLRYLSPAWNKTPTPPKLHAQMKDEFHYSSNLTRVKLGKERKEDYYHCHGDKDLLCHSHDNLYYATRFEPRSICLSGFAFSANFSLKLGCRMPSLFLKEQINAADLLESIRMVLPHYLATKAASNPAQRASVLGYKANHIGFCLSCLLDPNSGYPSLPSDFYAQNKALLDSYLSFLREDVEILDDHLFHNFPFPVDWELDLREAKRLQQIVLRLSRDLSLLTLTEDKSPQSQGRQWIDFAVPRYLYTLAGLEIVLNKAHPDQALLHDLCLLEIKYAGKATDPDPKGGVWFKPLKYNLATKKPFEPDPDYFISPSKSLLQHLAQAMKNALRIYDLSLKTYINKQNNTRFNLALGTQSSVINFLIAKLSSPSKNETKIYRNFYPIYVYFFKSNSPERVQLFKAYQAKMMEDITHISRVISSHTISSAEASGSEYLVCLQNRLIRISKCLLEVAHAFDPGELSVKIVNPILEEHELLQKQVLAQYKRLMTMQAFCLAQESGVAASAAPTPAPRSKKPLIRKALTSEAPPKPSTPAPQEKVKHLPIVEGYLPLLAEKKLTSRFSAEEIDAFLLAIRHDQQPEPLDPHHLLIDSAKLFNQSKALRFAAPEKFLVAAADLVEIATNKKNRFLYFGFTQHLRKISAAATSSASSSAASSAAAPKPASAPTPASTSKTTATVTAAPAKAAKQEQAKSDSADAVENENSIAKAIRLRQTARKEERDRKKLEAKNRQEAIKLKAEQHEEKRKAKEQAEVKAEPQPAQVTHKSSASSITFALRFPMKAEDTKASVEIASEQNLPVTLEQNLPVTLEQNLPPVLEQRTPLPLAGEGGGEGLHLADTPLCRGHDRSTPSPCPLPPAGEGFAAPAPVDAELEMEKLATKMADFLLQDEGSELPPTQKASSKGTYYGILSSAIFNARPRRPPLPRNRANPTSSIEDSHPAHRNFAN